MNVNKAYNTYERIGEGVQFNHSFQHYTLLYSICLFHTVLPERSENNLFPILLARASGFRRFQGGSC